MTLATAIENKGYSKLDAQYVESVVTSDEYCDRLTMNLASGMELEAGMKEAFRVVNGYRMQRIINHYQNNPEFREDFTRKIYNGLRAQ